MAQSARGTNPHASVTIFSERKAVCIVPDQPIILRKAAPALPIVDSDARVFTNPQPAPMIHDQRHDLFGHQRWMAYVFGLNHLVPVHVQTHQILRWTSDPDI